MKIKSLKLKLIFSYVFTALVSFGLFVFFWDRNMVFAGLVLSLGFAFVLGFLAAERIISPVNKMIQVSRKFSEGDFSRRISLFSKDEMGQLASGLNKMAQDIENKIREIKEQNQKLSAIFNSMIEGVVVVDKSGRVVSINPTVEKIFDVRRKDTEGKIFLEAIRNNDIAEVINAVLEEGKALSSEITLVYPVRGILKSAPRLFLITML